MTRQDPEFVIHCALVELLRRDRLPDVVFFHPSSGEERTKRLDPKTGKLFCPGGTRLQRMGLRKGVPDLVIVHRSRVYGLEIKGPAGRLTREQYEFREEFTKAGGVYAVAGSVTAGREILSEWGVIRC